MKQNLKITTRQKERKKPKKTSGETLNKESIY